MRYSFVLYRNGGENSKILFKNFCIEISRDAYDCSTTQHRFATFCFFLEYKFSGNDLIVQIMKKGINIRAKHINDLSLLCVLYFKI